MCEQLLESVNKERSNGILITEDWGSWDFSFSWENNSVLIDWWDDPVERENLKKGGISAVMSLSRVTESKCPKGGFGFNKKPRSSSEVTGEKVAYVTELGLEFK